MTPRGAPWGECVKSRRFSVADIVGYSRLAGTDEERTLSRLLGLRSDLIDPAIDAHHGRIVKRTGDGSLIEFRSVVEAVRCAIEVQSAMIERNAGVPQDRRIVFRIGVHLGDVVEEADGDLMGEGVNIAARLEGIADPGGICVSASAYEHVRGRIEAQFVDIGEMSLKNIMQPVRVYATKPGSHGEIAHPTAALQPQGRPRLSIVVLPFVNMTGEPAQEYFVDGITESLTSDLSRIGGSFVIGRNTAFTYKGKPVDLKQIGRELNVRYALEGSVQRSGERMRVSVQLTDAESGNQLWADRFDKRLADLFDMQDEIVARLANALFSRLYAAETRRAERSVNPDALDLVFQGWGCYNKGATSENLGDARSFFERALAIDPTDLGGLVGVASVDMQLALSYVVNDRAERLSVAEALLNKALAIAPDNSIANLCMGVLQIYTNRATAGVRLCERALELAPNLAMAHAYIGAGKLLLGQAEETEAYILKAPPNRVQIRLRHRNPTGSWTACARPGSPNNDRRPPPRSDSRRRRRRAGASGWHIRKPR